MATKFTRALFLLGLSILSMLGAAWRYSASEAQSFPESQLELRSTSAPQVGQPYVVDIYANVTAPAYGFGIQVAYDPSVLQLDLQQDSDGTSVPMRIGGVFASAHRIRNNQSAEGTTATVDAVYTLLPPAEAVQGESFIGRVSFTVLQAAPTQVTLVTPRLIALENGTARDLPVVVGGPLAVNEGSTVVASAPVEQPQVQVVPVAAPEIAAAPVAQSVLTTVDTPREVLDQMNRTNTLMNAVAVGLLVMMGLMLIVMVVSTLIDARETARAQRSMSRAYAHAARSFAQAQAQQARPVVETQRPNVMTMPSRTLQMTQALLNRRRSSSLYDDPNG